MKEATGEANMTVVTIILIAAIVAVATPVITKMMDNTNDRAACMSCGGVWDGTVCETADGTGTVDYSACKAD